MIVAIARKGGAGKALLAAALAHSAAFPIAGGPPGITCCREREHAHAHR